MSKGERLRQLREGIGLSQVEAAERIGVSKQTLYKYEKDIITNIPSDVIERIATLYNTTPAAIMGWENQIIPDPVNPEKDQIERALNFCNKFDNASPEVRSAISSLLGLDQ